MIGDFNAILLAKEKISLCPPSTLSVKEFSEMALAAGLKDLASEVIASPGLIIGKVRLLSQLGWTELFPTPYGSILMWIQC